MRLLLLSGLCLAGSLLLTSCETTGDPRQGGLFGWSESKAQNRLADREDRLDQTESDTDRVERQNRRMRRQLDDQ